MPYKFDLGDGEQYLRWNGFNLFVRGIVTIKGGSSGIANLTDAGALATLDSIEYAAITGAKPPTNADNTASHPQNVAWLTDAGALAYYNLVSAALLDNTIIIGGFIKTSLLTADNIRTGTLDTIRLNVGAGTNNDIYFKDSGIRMYDMGGQVINLYKSGLKYLRLVLGGTYSQLATDGKLSLNGNDVEILSAFKTFKFHTAGGFQMCNIYSRPTGHAGDIAYNSAQHRFQMYVGGGTNAWGYELMSAGW